MGVARKKLYVYVETESNDPIPGIIFTQHISDNRAYETKSLVKGLNIIDVPDLYDKYKNDGWTTATEKGGCIYISNPYTENQQSSNVKVYIEGGDKIPVFKKGDDKNKFYDKLEEYHKHLSNGESGYHDVAEIAATYNFMTISFEYAYKAFVQSRTDPNVTVKNWDKFLVKMFEFDGLTYDQYKNFWHQVKLNQPYGAAYATAEIVAIQHDIWEAKALTGEILGWGFAHEFGHCLDNVNRLYVEKSNNMWSMFYTVNQKYVDGWDFSAALKKIAPDTNKYTWDDFGFDGIMAFWNLEVFHNGYWAELDTMYRSNTTGNATADSYAASCSSNEKLALYSSKIIGIDLTYYFERWGLLSNESSAYKNAINALTLSKEEPKIWYYNGTTSYGKTDKSNLGKYVNVSVESVSVTSAGTTIDLNIPKNYEDAHLGYEIVRDGVVIGFTWDNEYVDKEVTSKSDKTYVINAYDLKLNKYSSASFNLNYYSTNSVAMINSNGTPIYYSSLNDAVQAAKSGDTVYLMKSCGITNIAVSGKSITIMPYSNDRRYVLYQTQDSNIFSVSNNGCLTLATPEGSEDNTFILDGRGDTNGTRTCGLTSAFNGTIIIKKGVTIQSCPKYTNAIYANKGVIKLEGCIIKDNRTKHGTIHADNGSTLYSSNGTKIIHNFAKEVGSGIYSSGSVPNYVYITDTELCYNYTENLSGGGACIYAEKGLVDIGDGTYMHDNKDDDYNNANGIYLSNDTEGCFSGKLNISDNVQIRGTASAKSNISGIVKIKTNFNDDRLGLKVIKLPDSDFSNAVKTFVYSNDEYSLVKDGNYLVLGEYIKLSNNSKISSSSIKLGSSIKLTAKARGGTTIKLTGKATGGTTHYKYTYFCKPEGSAEWTTIKNISTSSSCTHKPARAINYQYGVRVTDAKGKELVKYFTVKVTKPATALANNSTISATSIKLGTTIKFTAKATGGTAPYTYKYYCRPSTSSDYTALTGSTRTATYTHKPTRAITYNYAVKVADSKGATKTKYFTVKVSKPLTNSSAISATSIKLGTTIKLTAKATGGTAPYTYKYYCRPSTSSDYTALTGSTTTATFTHKPARAITYNYAVKVADSKGATKTKYFTVKVTKPAAALANNSTISATSIELGSSVKLTAKATGGTAPYTYKYFCKPSTSSNYTALTVSTTTATFTHKPARAITYNYAVKVADSKGATKTKYFTVKVTEPSAELTNASAISATSVKLGTTIKLTAKATGGTAPYTYRYYCKPSTSANYTALTVSTTTATFTHKPARATTYKYAVKITDSKGATKTKYFTVKVS